MQRHGFHLVDPSPWPILASISLLGLCMGLVAWFQFFYLSIFLLIFSFLTLGYVASIWWRDVIWESVFQGHHTGLVQYGLIVGMILFILSEVMVFSGFFFAFGYASLAPTIDIGAIWPPSGIQVLDPFAVPFLNTLILLTSGASITWAHHSLLQSQMKETWLALMITIALAFIFTILQSFEYLTANFTISDSVYGSNFYLLTGLHGFHVVLGTMFLMVTLGRIKQLRPDHHVGFELAALYWHFVDIVWLFVYIFVYYWSS